MAQRNRDGDLFSNETIIFFPKCDVLLLDFDLDMTFFTLFSILLSTFSLSPFMTKMFPFSDFSRVTWNCHLFIF